MSKFKELAAEVGELTEASIWLATLPQYKCPVCGSLSPFISGHADCLALEELIGYEDQYRPIED